MRVGGSHAGVEIMLLAMTSGARFVEVPVNYLPRVGISSVTGRRLGAVERRAADDRADPALPPPHAGRPERPRRRSSRAR